MSEYAQRYLDRFSAALIADSAFRAGAALDGLRRLGAVGGSGGGHVAWW